MINFISYIVKTLKNKAGKIEIIKKEK